MLSFFNASSRIDTAFVNSSDAEFNGHPVMVELVPNPDTFSLDPNEVFRHADQFTLESGCLMIPQTYI